MGLRTAGLFAGIGGLELGLSRAGHRAELLVEIDAAANAVLDARFPGVARAADVREIDSLPSGVDLIAAGFPCQDLSQAGETRGIEGGRSGLVEEVFRLARSSRAAWILLENVPFMLRLHRGEAMRRIVQRLESLGYAWAYRTVDSRAFGLPQRRERVYLLASREADPASLLFADRADPPPAKDWRGSACGFYWTEGTRGLGWAVDAIPTLKGGSAIGIPSPPAIWFPDDRVCTPEIRDAERLQGFDPDWTRPAETAARPGYRWKLVGNAVSPPAAEWIGHVLSRASAAPVTGQRLASGAPWPAAAFGHRARRWSMDASKWPAARRAPALAEFLEHPAKPLSERAAAGFHSRLTASTLRYPPEFLAAIERHARAVSPAPAAPPPRRSRPRLPDR